MQLKVGNAFLLESMYNEAEQNLTVSIDMYRRLDQEDTALALEFYRESFQNAIDWYMESSKCMRCLTEKVLIMKKWRVLR